jgi:hypothetical protein
MTMPNPKPSKTSSVPTTSATSPTDHRLASEEREIQPEEAKKKASAGNLTAYLLEIF